MSYSRLRWRQKFLKEQDVLRKDCKESKINQVLKSISETANGRSNKAEEHIEQCRRPLKILPKLGDKEKRPIWQGERCLEGWHGIESHRADLFLSL